MYVLDRQSTTLFGGNCPLSLSHKIREIKMSGGMGKNSRSKRSFKGTCEDVDVKAFGSKDVKKHLKRTHHRAIRYEGKRQTHLEENEHNFARKTERK